MTELPEPLTHCRVPKAFSPSQLAFGEQCLLRAVLGSTRHVPALTAHPAAAIGSVFHKLLELAVRGQIPREGSAKEDAQRALDRLLDEEDARLEAAWAGDPPRLREVFPPLTWRRKRRAALDLAEKYLSGSLPKSSAAAGDGVRSARDLPANGKWSEVYLDAPSLRLRGRADLIERNAVNVVIRDLKTGRVLTHDGDLLPPIERQMRLYGAMAHDIWPSARVSLILDHGVEREIEFTPEQELDVRIWLRGVLDRLPPDLDVVAASLGNVGEACDGCAYRHVCPAYRCSAPDYWRAEGPLRMPLDVWGEVVSVASPQGGLADLMIRDAAGRLVKVFGLAGLRGKAVRPGDKICLFGLRTRDKRGGPALWRHPRNFFEVADDDPSARAWTTQMFVVRHS